MKPIGTINEWAPEFHSRRNMLIAKYIKKQFDHRYKGTWHCVAGTSLGSGVIHESKMFIFMNAGLNNLAILLFRAGAAFDCCALHVSLSVED